MAEDGAGGGPSAGLDRAALERRLETTVRENRFTIAVVFPVLGAVLLIASAEGLLPAVLSFNPYLILIGTIVMRLPLVAGLAPLIDRRAAWLLLALTGYAYGIELVGTITGWPYGEFRYLIELGPMLLGKVPLGLPVFFFPLVLNSYLLVLLLLRGRARNRWLRLAGTLATVLAVDLVLDPGAVAIGFWEYAAGGAYYGVPATNYAGWVLSGTVAVVTFDLAFEYGRLRERLTACEFMLDDLVSFVLLWGSITLFYRRWIAVGIAALLVVGLLKTDRFDFDVLRRTAWLSGR